MSASRTPQTLLVWTENYWIGGCDRFLVDLIGGLRDHPVRIVLAGNPHPAFDEWLAARVPWVLPRTVIPVANLVRTPLHHLDRMRRSGPIRPTEMAEDAPTAPASADGAPLRAAIACARYGQAAVNFARLTSLMRDLAPDALLINNGGYPGAESCRVAALAARRAGVPRVVHFVHNMAAARAWPPAVEAVLDRQIDRAVDVWVTAAHRASARLAEAREISMSRIETIHYGIDATDPSAPAEAPGLRAQLGFTGPGPRLAVIANLEPRKGLSVLIRALVALRQRGVLLPTAIVGEGPMRVALERQIAEAGLAKDVRLLGWRDDVPAILTEADLLVLPSLASECLPYVILEAMGHSLPVVSTDVAGIPEMVEDRLTGRIVRPGDSTALADALADVTGQPERAAAMGARGRERVLERFTLARMVEQMSDALRLG